MSLEESVLQHIENNAQEMIRGIAQIISIRSERGTPEKDAPYGRGPKQALVETLRLAQNMGFKTEMIENQIGIVKYGQGDEYIGIVGHLDVVEAKEGWTSDPYILTERNGRLYARGILDNKGPILANLYALKAIKDLGVELKHPIWIIFGTNEETGMEDIPVFLKHKRPPVAGWTPDNKFPVVYAERGRAVYQIVFSDLDHERNWLNRYLLENISKEKALGLDVKDPEFGVLDIRNTVLDEKGITFSVSYPPCIDTNQITDQLKKTLKDKDELIMRSDWKPVFFEKESPLCKILRSAYEDMTGSDGTPTTTTGGTYAKRVPNILPFGPSFPGQKGIGHLPDEWMDIQDLIMNAKIYGLSMIRLGLEENL